MNTSSKYSRLAEIDVLRGIAALAVVFYHFFTRYDRHYNYDFEVPDFIRFGATGVQLFFIISGFVIFWTLSKTQSYKDFLAARFARLYPAYWAAVTITAIVISFPIAGELGLEVSFAGYLVNLTMFQEFLKFEHVDGVYWTLTVELLFYFLISTIFILNGFKYIRYILLGFMMLSMFWWYFKDQNVLIYYVGKILILDYICYFSAGICFYKLWIGDKSKLDYLIILVSIICNFFYHRFDEAVFIVIYYLIMFAIVNNHLRFIIRREFLFLGKISYPLYLVHQNIGFVIIFSLLTYQVSPFFAIAIAMLIVILLAYLISKYIEYPGQRYFKSKFVARSLSHQNDRLS